MGYEPVSAAIFWMIFPPGLEQEWELDYDYSWSWDVARGPGLSLQSSSPGSLARWSRSYIYSHIVPSASGQSRLTMLCTWNLAAIEHARSPLPRKDVRPCMSKQFVSTHGRPSTRPEVRALPHALLKIHTPVRYTALP